MLFSLALHTLINYSRLSLLLMGPVLNGRLGVSPVSGGGLSKYRYALDCALRTKDHASNSRLFSILHELLEELKGIATERLFAGVHHRPISDGEAIFERAELGAVLRLMDSELDNIKRAKSGVLEESKGLVLEAREAMLLEMREFMQLARNGEFACLLERSTPGFGQGELRVLVEGLRKESGKAA